MSDVLKEKTVNFKAADMMTIPQLRNAKQIVKAKLAEYKGEPATANKLQSMLYEYDKKELAINRFYTKCVRHKNPNVISLVNGKRNLLRFVDIKRVSKSGEISDINLKSAKRERPDYTAGDFLHDINAHSIAVGVGIATIGVGFASMEFGGKSLLGLIKAALSSLSKNNAIGVAAIFAGATLIASSKVAQLISKKAAQIRRNRDKSNQAQNEIFEQMNGKEPSEFSRPKEQIAADIANHPNLLSFYENAVKEPEKYGLTISERINVLGALKEAYSQIDDFERVMRGEPTKAELAEMQKKKEIEAANTQAAKSEVSKLKAAVAGISGKSTEADIAAVRNSLPSVETAIAKITDEQVKAGLLQEVETAKSTLESKANNLNKLKEEEAKKEVATVENELNSLSAKIEKVNEKTPASEITALKSGLSSIETKISALPESAAKTSLQTKFGSIKEGLDKKVASIQEKIETEKESKEGEAENTTNEADLRQADENLLLKISNQVDEILKQVEEMDISNYALGTISEGIKTARNYLQDFNSPEKRDEAKAKIDDATKKYTEKYKEIENKVKEQENSKTKTNEEELYSRLFECKDRIKGMKGGKHENYLDILKNAGRELELIKIDILKVTNPQEKTLLMQTYNTVKREHESYHSRYIGEKEIRNELFSIFKEMGKEDDNKVTKDNVSSFGQRIDAVRNKVYKGNNYSLNVLEKVEKRYLERSLKLEGNKYTTEFENINKKFREISNKIENLTSENKNESLSEIKKLILEIETDIDDLPSIKKHFRLKLEDEKTRLKDVEKQLSADEAERSNDKFLAETLSEYEQHILRLNEYTYEEVIKGLEAETKKITDIFSKITEDSDTNQHYKHLANRFKEEYIAAKLKVEQKIIANNNKLVSEIQNLKEDAKKLINSLDKDNVQEYSVKINSYCEQIDRNASLLKEIVGKEKSVGLSAPEVTAILKEIEDGKNKKIEDLKTSEKSENGAKISDENSSNKQIEADLRYIESEITAVAEMLEKGDINFRDKGLDKRVDQLRSNVYRVNNPELTEKFKDLINKTVNYANDGAQKEENSTLQVRYISSKFKEFRGLMHNYKTTTSFDSVANGKTTKDYLSDKLTEIGNEIKKLPEGSPERSHFEQRYIIERDSFDRKSNKHRDCEHASSILNGVQDDIAQLTENMNDINKYSGESLLRTLDNIEKRIIKIDSSLVNYKGKRVSDLKTKLEECKGKFETIKTAYKEPIERENNAALAKLETHAQNIREITKKITPTNYSECDKEFSIEINGFDKVIFFDKDLVSKKLALKREIVTAYKVQYESAKESFKKENGIGLDYEEFDAIKNEIQKEFVNLSEKISSLNVDNIAKNQSEIEKRISDFETWTISTGKMSEEMVQEIKEIIAARHKVLKENYDKAKESIEKEKEPVVDNSSLKSVENEITRLENLVSQLKLQEFEGKSEEYRHEIEDLKTKINSFENDTSALKERLDKLENLFNSTYATNLKPHIEKEMKAFEKNMKDFINSATLYGGNTDMIALMDMDFNHIKESIEGIKNTPDGKDLVKKFEQLSKRYEKQKNTSLAQVKQNSTKKAEEEKQREEEIVETKVTTKSSENDFARKKAEFFSRKMQYGLIDYTKSLSLAMAESKVGAEYPMAIQALKSYLVKKYIGHGMTEVKAEAMFNKETGDFSGGAEYGFIKPENDPELAEVLNRCQILCRSKKRFKEDRIEKDRGILESNVKLDRTRLVATVMKKLGISREESEKLITENGELIRNESTNGLLNDAEINKIVEDIKKGNDTLNRYKQACAPGSENEKIRDQISTEMRKGILNNLEAEYNSTKEISGKEMADAGFVKACKELGRRPSEIAKMLNIQGVDYTATFNDKIETKKVENQAEVVKEPENEVVEEEPVITEEVKKAIEAKTTHKKSEEEYKAALKANFIKFREAIIDERGEKGKNKDLKIQLGREEGSILKEYEEDYGKLEAENAKNEIRNRCNELQNKIRAKINDYKAAKDDNLRAKIEKEVNFLCDKFVNEFGEKIAADVKKEMEQAKNRKLTYMSVEEHRNRIRGKLEHLGNQKDPDEMKVMCVSVRKTIEKAQEAYPNESFDEFIEEVKVYEELKNEHIQSKIDLTNELKRISEQYKKIKIQLERNNADNSVAAVEYLTGQLDEVAKKMDSICKSMESFGPKIAEGAKRIVDKCKGYTVSEQDLKSGQMTLNGYKERIKGKINYYKGLDDLGEKNQIGESIKKAILKAESAYGDGCVEDLKEEFKAIATDKQRMSSQDVQEYRGMIESYIKDYGVKLSANLPDAEESKQLVVELVKGFDYQFELTPDVKDLQSFAAKSIAKVEIENSRDDIIHDFGKVISVEECETEIRKILKSYHAEEQKIVNELKNEIESKQAEIDQMRKEGKPENEIAEVEKELSELEERSKKEVVVPGYFDYKRKVDNYFKYIKVAHGKANLASLKYNAFDEMIHSGNHYKDERVKLEDGRVSSLKEAISGVERSKEFTDFIAKYNKLYLVSKATKQKASTGKTEQQEFKELYDSLPKKGLTDKQIEVARKLMEIAEMADAKAIEDVKTSTAGKNLNQADLDKQETSKAIENRIIEMINQGLDEKQIVEMLGDENKKSQVASLMKKEAGKAVENRIVKMINQGLDENQIVEMLGDKSKKSQVANLMKKYGAALEM